MVALTLAPAMAAQPARAPGTLDGTDWVAMCSRRVLTSLSRAPREAGHDLTPLAAGAQNARAGCDSSA